MHKTKKFAVIAGGAAALGMLFAASAFADSRHQDETWRNDRGRVERRDDRRESNARGERRAISMEGKIRSLDREGDGYRVHLDRGRDSFFVPGHVANAYRNRGGLRVGINIRLGGYWDPRGYVYVDRADWLDDDYRYRNDGYYDDYGHDRGTVRGVIERIDYRRGVLTLRDRNSGRHVNVAMDRRSYNSRGVDFQDLRRGDFVTLAGEWVRGNVFEAYRIEGVRSR